MAGGSILVVDDSATILKVVELVLSKAGYRVRTASDGEAALPMAQEQPPDLILVDFVMPKMNGYQFCRELSQIDTMRGIPVVLMSAKGDQIGERFVKVLGIVDYITKPFAPEALCAVVEHTLVKYGRGVREHSGPLPPPDIEALSPAAVDTSLRERIAASVSRHIAGLLALANLGDERRLPDQASIEAAARKALEETSLAEAIALGEQQHGTLRGDIRLFPIAEVLQLLAAQVHTGRLLAINPVSSIEVHFRRGRVDLALAHGVSEEFLLGRYIVKSQLMTQEAFDSFLASRDSGRLLGAELVATGALSADDLLAALRLQTMELIFEMLRWASGQFTFHAGADAPVAVREAALALDVETLLLEGYRRVDEWHVIEREISDFELVFLRNEESIARLAKGQLSRDDSLILEQVNGKHSVKDIVRRTRLSSYEVSRLLYRLLQTRLIRRKIDPVATQ